MGRGEGRRTRRGQRSGADERTLDLRVTADGLDDLRTRPLGLEPIPYLFFEVSPVTQKAGGRPTSEALVVVRGTRAAGGLEILSLSVGDMDDGDFWEGVLVDLHRRGLAGVRLIMTPDLPALRSPIEAVLPDAQWEQSAPFVRPGEA